MVACQASNRSTYHMIILTLSIPTMQWMHFKVYPDLLKLFDVHGHGLVSGVVCGLKLRY